MRALGIVEDKILKEVLPEQSSDKELMPLYDVAIVDSETEAIRCLQKKYTHQLQKIIWEIGVRAL